jgi:hypothetical protein
MATQEDINTALAEWLAVSDEKSLIEQLGIRAAATRLGRADAISYTSTPTYDGAVMGAMDDVRTLGRRLLNRWNHELFKVMCGSEAGDAEDRESLLKAIGATDLVLASAMTTVLVSSFAVAPAVATILSALIVKRIFNPAGEEFCKFWATQLPTD